MNATEQIERAQNAADIRAGRERLESGQVVRRDELRVGDIIMGAGEVTYVHNFNGGQYTRVLIDADPSTTTLGDCDDAGNTIRPSEVKVTIEPRAKAAV